MLNNDRRLLYACSLQFLTTAFIITSLSYVNLLLLSNYTSKQLPLFYLGQAIVSIAYIFLTKNIMGSKPRQYSVGLFTCSLITLLIFIYLLRVNPPWAAFVCSVLLMLINSQLGVNAWNVITLAFDVREFKKAGRWPLIFSTVGAICMGFSIPIFIKLFDTSVMLYLLIVLLLALIPFALALKPLPEVKVKLPRGVNVIRYPLFNRVFIFFILVIVAGTLIDYCFKVTLQQHYTKAQIGEFMGIFLGVTSVVTLCIQYFAINKLVEQFGNWILLIMYPVIILLIGITAIIWPIFTVIILLASANTALHYSYNTLGYQLYLNILPDQIRRMGQAFIKSLGTPIGMGGISVILLWLLATNNGLTQILWAITIICILSSLTIPSIIKSYQNTLAKEVAQNRFSPEMDAFGRINPSSTNQVLKQLLTSKDIEKLHFGLSLLNNLQTTHFNSYLSQLIHSNIVDIRIESIKLLMKNKDDNTSHILSSRLDTENDPKVLYWLFKALYEVAPENALSQALTFYQSNKPFWRDSAIGLLCIHENHEAQTHAQELITQMAMSPSVDARCKAASAVGFKNLPQLTPILIKLIQDKNSKVQLCAINAAENNLTPEVCHILANQQGNSLVIHNAFNVLIKAGLPSMKFLMENIEQLKSPKLIRARIHTMARMNGPDAESNLMKLSVSNHMLLRNAVAKQSAYRARHMLVSTQFRHHAKVQCLSEMKRLESLVELRTHSLTTFIQQEITNRIMLAQERYFYWLAVQTNAVLLLSIIPSLLMISAHKSSKSLQAKAIEFLDLNLKDRKLAKSIIMAIESAEKPASTAPHTIEQLVSNDAWLSKCINYKTIYSKGVAMDITQKAFLLRSVEFFKQLPAELITTIAQYCHTQPMIQGEKLFGAGDLADNLYMVAHGSVSIELNGKQLALLGQGDAFGELSLIDNRPRLADAIVLEDGDLLTLSMMEFNQILDDIPEVSKAIIKVILTYLRQDLSRDNVVKSHI